MHVPVECGTKSRHMSIQFVKQNTRVLHVEYNNYSKIYNCKRKKKRKNKKKKEIKC